MLVSVVIPVHNAEPYLAECLESVLAQDYAPIEIVAVDNNSTDESSRLLREFEHRGIRVVAESRVGAAIARNTGIRAARGDFIAFHDADDIWLPGKLARQMRYLSANSDVGIVFGQFANWYPDQSGRFPPWQTYVGRPETWEVSKKLSGWIYVDTLLACPIAMITPVIRREVIDVAGYFDETLPAGSDYDFWLRATHRFMAHRLSGCLALYRHHGRGITSQARSYSTMALILERALRTMGRSGPDGRTVTQEQIDARFAEVWLQFGLLHLQKGQLTIARHAFAKYLRREKSAMVALRTLASGIPAGIRERVRGRMA